MTSSFAPNKPNDTLVVVGHFEKNARESVVARLTRYKGYELVDIRSFALNREGELVATTKGLTVKVELIPDLLKLLAGTYREAARLGLIPPQDHHQAEPGPERGPLTDAERARRYRKRKRHAQSGTVTNKVTNGRDGHDELDFGATR